MEDGTECESIRPALTKVFNLDILCVEGERGREGGREGGRERGREGGREGGREEGRGGKGESGSKGGSEGGSEFWGAGEGTREKRRKRRIKKDGKETQVLHCSKKAKDGGGKGKEGNENEAGRKERG